jgi:hypothetical protein
MRGASCRRLWEVMPLVTQGLGTGKRLVAIFPYKDFSKMLAR